jgi:hypothetical protein
MLKQQALVRNRALYAGQVQSEAIRYGWGPLDGDRTQIFPTGSVFVGDSAAFFVSIKKYR